MLMEAGRTWARGSFVDNEDALKLMLEQLWTFYKPARGLLLRDDFMVNELYLNTIKL